MEFNSGFKGLTSRSIKFTEFNYANNYRLIKKDSATQSSLFSYVVSWLVWHCTLTTGPPSNLRFNYTKLNSGSANLPSKVLYLLLKDAAPIPGILEGHDLHPREWLSRGGIKRRCKLRRLYSVGGIWKSYDNGASVEWCWQGKTRGEKTVPVLLCPPQVPHGMITNPLRASAMTVLGPTARAVSFIGRPRFTR